MKRISFLGCIMSLLLCAAAFLAPAVGHAQTAPTLPIVQADRAHSRSSQQIADEWAAAMPQTKWSSYADTDWYTADGTEFTLTAPEQFAGLAKLVNSGKNMKGITIKLGKNVDFAAHRFDEVIGMNNDNPFSGTFEGGNYTISGVKIFEPKGAFVGFFGQTNEAVIRNTVVRNATVVGSNTAGAFVSNVYNKGLVSNCHAYDCRVVTAPFETSFGGSSAGSVVGAMVDFSKMENCSATDMEIYCVGQSGAFISQAYNQCEVTNCFVEDSKLTADVGLIGGFVGANLAFFPGTQSTFTNCYALDVDLVLFDAGEQAIAGGFVGMAQANFTVKHCYASVEIEGGASTGAFAGLTGGESAVCIYEGCFYNSDKNGDMPGVGGGVEVATIVGMQEIAMRTAEMAATLNGAQNPAPWKYAADVNDGWPYLGDNAPVVTSVPATMDDALHITASQGQIVVAGMTAATDVQIYNMQGYRIYANSTAMADLRIEVAPGVYVVRAGRSIAKVAVY